MNIADKLLTIAENIPKVYEAGQKAGGDYESAYNDGYDDGYTEGETTGYNNGVADGRTAEWSDLWDDFQNNGTRRNYQNAFALYSWSDKTFKPKYDLIVTNGSQMFIQNQKITNLKKLLDDAGVTLDFSNNTNALQCFQLSAMTHLPTIDLSMVTNASYVFASMSNLVEIEKLILSSKTPQNNMFYQTPSLTTLTIEGVIDKNGFNVQWSTKLSRTSFLSILKALNITVIGVTVTLPTNCIDGATNTLTTIQNDTELNSAYTTAIANGYTIAFA